MFQCTLSTRRHKMDGSPFGHGYSVIGSWGITNLFETQCFKGAGILKIYWPKAFGYI